MRISDWSSDVCSSDLPTPGVSRYASPQPQSEPPLTTPADRRVLTASLPPLQDADARAIEAFIDATRAESGLARTTPDRDRRGLRSEERSVGKEGGETGRCRGSPDLYTKNKNKE